MQNWQTGIVTAVSDLSATTRNFTIELPETSNFEFKPGQFITLDLPIHERRNKRWRSYSIASAPNGTNSFDLCVVRLDNGAGTRYLFETATVGTALTLKGPDGMFNLPNNMTDETAIVFICTGTGVAPFKSMIDHIVNHGLPHQYLHLIFGTRTTDNLLYRDFFEALQAANPRFTYTPVLSRADESWQGNRGYVHSTYERLLSQTAGTKALFYLCGWSNMVDEARLKLNQLGISSDRIIYELYG